MDYCLVCFAEITPQIGWTKLFAKEAPVYLCSACRQKFIPIKGRSCIMCDRPLAAIDRQFIVNDCCGDCLRWEEDAKWAGTLQKNYALIIYNDFAQEVIARFKFRGDYLLAYAFAALLQEKLSMIAFDIIVPIPLSNERLYARGFNQSEALIHACGYKPACLLTRMHTEKQSKKTRFERIHLPQVFQIKEKIPGQTVLLIDDIYTTGSTIRHAAKLLKEAGASIVNSLTLAR